VPCSLIVLMISKIRSTKIGARPSEGSSSSSSLGRAIQGAGDRAHLLLTPGHRPGLLGAALVQPREEAEDALHVLADTGLVVPLERPHLEVLGHRHAREEPPAFR